MSFIIFDGNTYTFGATVSANPGTGTTSYVFTSLIPGSTYGFIIWAFNGFGSSPITGPVTKVTLTDEFREEIVVYSWVYPGIDFSDEVVYDFTVQNYSNKIVPSQPFISGATNQFGPNQYFVDGSTGTVTTGFTAPDGSTTATQVVKPTNFSYRLTQLTSGPFTFPYPTWDSLKDPTGATHYFSFWQNTSLGNTTNFAVFIQGRRAVAPYNNFTTFTTRQIYPSVGATSDTFPGASIVYPSGNCGWVRFVFETVAKDSLTDFRDVSPAFFRPSAGGTFYVWGVQLERGNTFPQSRYDAGISDYKPNIMISGLTFRDIENVSIQNSGITVWDNNPDWVSTWNTNNGFTYFWPNINMNSGYFPGAGQRYNEWLVPGSTLNAWLNRTLEYLKKLPEKHRAIRANQLENISGLALLHYDDAITSQGYNVSGTTFEYYDSNYTKLFSATGYVGGIWPSAGISAGQSLYEIFAQAFAATGATLSYIIYDQEGFVYDGDDFELSNANAGRTAALIVENDPRYLQTWNGITALGQFMSGLGATLSKATGANYSDLNLLSWSRCMSYHFAKSYELITQPLRNRFPNILIGNYDAFDYTGPWYLAPKDLNGNNVPGGRSLPDFGSPYLYGQIQNIYSSKISATDPSNLDGFYARNRLINSDIVGITGLKTSGGSGSYPILGVTSPFGNYEVSLFTENTSNSNHRFEPGQYNGQGYSIWKTGGGDTQSYVFSIYLKRPEVNAHRYVTLLNYVEAGSGFSPFSRNIYNVTFDLLTGTTTQAFVSTLGCGYTSPFRSHGIQHSGNSWYRCWISDAGITYWNNYYVLNTVSSSNSPTPSAANGPSYTGNGISGFYAWGAQFETGTTPSELERKLPSFTRIGDLNQAWASFIWCMQYVRSHRNTTPTVPFIPWIANVSWAGQEWGAVDANGNVVGTRPEVGFADVTLGYNPRQGHTYTYSAGNSAYWYEMVRHTMLHGTKAISQWGGFLYTDDRYPTYRNYLQNGNCAWYYEIKELNDTVKEVNNIIGGYTLTTADTSRPSWTGKYLASGSPGPKGTTWWWRVTVNPQNKIVVNGTTLDGASGPYGTWVSTTGPTLAHVPISILS